MEWSHFKNIAVNEINDCLNDQDSVEVSYLSPTVTIVNDELERSNQTWKKQIEQATDIKNQRSSNNKY